MATLLFLGRLADSLGQTEQSCDLPPNIRTSTHLRAWLDERHDLNGVLLEPTVRVAINDEIISDPAPLSNTDVIAFLPPVGGG
jgi:molybdopterin converting factor subunit 1